MIVWLKCELHHLAQISGDAAGNVTRFRKVAFRPRAITKSRSVANGRAARSGVGNVPTDDGAGNRTRVLSVDGESSCEEGVHAGVKIERLGVAAGKVGAGVDDQLASEHG